MENNRQWLAIAGAILLIVGFLWWRGRTAAPESPITDEDIELEERVNRFLEDQGITLPEGSQRVNLRDVNDEGYTGVVTTQEEADSSIVTVIASLPDLEQGWYQAWVVNQDGLYESLGRLRSSKGGYILDMSTGMDLSEYSQFKVSRETTVSSQPSDVVLEGNFPVVEYQNDEDEEDSEE